MKNKKEELVLKRLEVLEPYISQGKSLKELSEEQDISYSTLKRWASAYKKNGADGLQKSGRSDKSTYRSISDETMNYIKEIYKKNPNLKILDYYNKSITFLKTIGEKSISYDTIYRIINKLDPYMKDYASSNLYNAKATNEVFELEYFQLDYYLLDERDDTLKKPYITIVYDNFSEAISAFVLTFEKVNINEALSLLRNAILSYKDTSYYGKPKEFIMNNLKFTEKELLETVKNKLSIQVSFSLGVTNKLQDFFNAYNDHYLKEIILTLDYDVTMSSLEELTKVYVDKNFNKFKQEKLSNPVSQLSRIESIADLDFLLAPYNSKRKVKDCSIRFQNLLYENPMLEKYEDVELEVKYNPLDLSKIKVYEGEAFLCDLSSEIIGDYPLSTYDFLCIKKAIKLKFGNTNINLKQYAQEFKELVQLKYTEEHSSVFGSKKIY